jgi:hypothetical protein
MCLDVETEFGNFPTGDRSFLFHGNRDLPPGKGERLREVKNTLQDSDQARFGRRGQDGGHHVVYRRGGLGR